MQVVNLATPLRRLAEFLIGALIHLAGANEVTHKKFLISQETSVFASVEMHKRGK